MFWEVAGLNIPSLIWIPHLAQLITYLYISTSWNLVGNLLPLSGCGCAYCFYKALYLFIRPFIFIYFWIYNTAEALSNGYRLTQCLTSLLTYKTSHLFPFMSSRWLHYFNKCRIFFLRPFWRLVQAALKVYSLIQRCGCLVFSLCASKLGDLPVAQFLYQITCGNQLRRWGSTRYGNYFWKSIVSDDWQRMTRLRRRCDEGLILALVHCLFDVCILTAALGYHMDIRIVVLMGTEVKAHFKRNVCIISCNTNIYTKFCNVSWLFTQLFMVYMYISCYCVF